MLPGSGAGATTGQTGVGLPSSARAPADVAPSATVVGLGRFADVVAGFLTGVDGFACAAALVASCAIVADGREAVITGMSSAKVQRRVERVVSTEVDSGRWFEATVVSESNALDFRGCILNCKRRTAFGHYGQTRFGGLLPFFKNVVQFGAAVQ